MSLWFIMMPSRKSKKFHGFTLIEVLLGVSLLSFVSLCVYVTFRTGMDIFKRLESQKGIYRQSQLVMNRFAKDIEDAVAYDFTGSYPGHSALEGKSDSIVFVARSQGKLKVVKYSLLVREKGVSKKTILGNSYKRNVTVTQYAQDAPVSFSLIREEVDFIEYISGNFQVSGPEETMAENIIAGGLKFAYAVNSDKANALAWRAEWKEPALPLAVRMHFIINDNGDKNAQNIDFDKVALMPGGINLKR